ncbi:MAG: Arm DNA-binding domain-containing protein [Acidimicrobiales bacterium]
MTGFVKKRGNTWSAFWETKDPATGRRRQHSKGGFRTQGAAQKHLNVVVGKVTTGDWRADQPITVRQLLLAGVSGLSL